MPTLLQINVVANWGSTGRIAEDIGQTALAAGWRSVIAYGRGNPTSNSELIRVGNDWDMYEHILEARLFDNQGLASRRATKKFIRQIEEIKPDIVHLHNIHGYYLNYDLLFQYLAEKDIPVVWTLHDCWSFTGHCAHFAFDGCGRWQTGCHHCPLKKTYPQSMWLDRSAQNYHLKRERFTSIPRLTLVPVSDWLAHLVEKSFLKECPIKRIYNGVDISVFAPDKEDKGKEPFRKCYELENKFIAVGCATTWTERKGFDDYLALSELLSENEILVMVGVNEEQRKNLPDNIIGLPRTESVAQLAQIYTEADVVLNLSYEETFGLTTVEGFACGTPSIVYNCTASLELIDEHTGYIVDAGDIQGIKECMEELSHKGKNYYSVYCRSRALSLFDKESQYHKYLDIYNELNCNDLGGG